MGKRAVVSGSGPEPVAEALQARGFEVVVAADARALAALAAESEAPDVDVYVQLPGTIAARGDNAIERVRNFLSDGLIARFDGADAVLPALKDDAVVVLVGGNHPGAGGAPDNPEARLSLMKVLGHTLLLERAGRGLAVKVLDAQRDAARIAALAAEPASRPLQIISDVSQISPDLDYSDWRNELMSMTATQT